LAGDDPSAQDYLDRFPDAAAVLSELFPASPEGGAAGPLAGALDTTADAERTGPHVEAKNPGQGEAPADQEAAPAAGRVRVLRFHKEGGLGKVFVARDVELHREVALKEIQGRHADNPDIRARFVLEAEITGNLEHPGIVPVYGLGCY